MHRRWLQVSILSLTVTLVGISPAAALQTPTQLDFLEDDVIAEAASNSETTDESTAKINQLERSENGLAVLTWTLHNQGSNTIPLPGEIGIGTYLYTGDPLSGITIHDKESDVRFHPLMDDETDCLCSAGSGWIEVTKVVGSNQYATYWATYQLPEDVDAVTVEIPGFEPIEDVPVS